MLRRKVYSISNINAWLSKIKNQLYSDTSRQKHAQLFPRTQYGQSET